VEDIIIKLPSELTIAQVDKYRQIFLDIIDENDVLVIDDSSLKRIDTVGVQLLLSTITSIAFQKKTLTWHSQSDAIKESIKQLGLNEAIFTQYLNI
jgi:anti-anti-sigma regulatory factor